MSCMAECMLNLWQFELSLHSCSGPWIWSHRPGLLSCFPELHMLCYKYRQSQPGKNESRIREVHYYAKLHFTKWNFLFNSAFSKLLMEMNAFFSLYSPEEKLGWSLLSSLFYIYRFSVSQIRVTLRELNLPKVSLRASGKGSNNFQLELLIMKYDLRNINKKVSK